MPDSRKRSEVGPRLAGLTEIQAQVSRQSVSRSLANAATIARCRVQGAGFRVQGAGYRVQGAGCRVQGAGCRVQGAGLRVQDAGFRVQGSRPNALSCWRHIRTTLREKHSS